MTPTLYHPPKWPLTSTLLYEGTHTLDRVGGHLEDVVDPVKDDLDDLRVLDIEQSAEGRDDSELDNMRHLVVVKHISMCGKDSGLTRQV